MLLSVWPSLAVTAIFYSNALERIFNMFSAALPRWLSTTLALNFAAHIESP
jgi:hypothetical protein